MARVTLPAGLYIEMSEGLMDDSAFELGVLCYIIWQVFLQCVLQRYYL